MTANEELESNLLFARRTRHGDSGDLYAQRKAIDWLLAHEEQAYPRLLEDLHAGVDLRGTVAVIARFRRAESIPALEQVLLGGQEEFRKDAGVALGQHPQPEARKALLEALHSKERSTLLGAMDGLRVLGDRSVCPELEAQLGAADSELRWMALHTLTKLGCLGAAELSRLASTDPDEYVRKLAQDALRALQDTK